MTLDSMLTHLSLPAVLFSCLGMIAAWVRPDLEIPQPGPTLCSLLLLGAFAVHYRVLSTADAAAPATAWLLRLAPGDGVLLGVLVGSAFYRRPRCDARGAPTGESGLQRDASAGRHLSVQWGGGHSPRWEARQLQPQVN